MRDFYHSKKYAQPPGTLIMPDEAIANEAESFRLISFSKDSYADINLDSLKELKQTQPDSLQWLVISNINSLETIKQLGERFNINQLTLEDIVNPNQRPKFDDLGHYIYLVMRCGIEEKKFPVLNIILLDNILITISHTEYRALELLVERVKNSKGKIRNSGIDYLFYAVMDLVVDEYFLLIDKSGEKLEHIENRVIHNKEGDIVKEIYNTRRVITNTHRFIRSTRDISAIIMRFENPLISNSLKLYFNDIYDHVVQISESCESQKEICLSILEHHLSMINNRMNEIIKVLTIMSTIFIPLTFIVGVYGMNFEHMPELKLKYGYPALMFIMAAIAVVMVFFFRRKKWF